MNSAVDIKLAERDSKVIAALRNALESMQLTHGARIIMAGVSGSLNFEQQMLDLRDALSLLCVDPDETTSKASARDCQPK